MDQGPKPGTARRVATCTNTAQRVMDSSDMKEPLEAGEDGTFDLGEPLPPPAPVRRKVITTTDGNTPPPAEIAPPGSPPIEDDWEEVDVKDGGEGPQLDSSGGTSEGALDDFKDAVEVLRPRAERTLDTTRTENASEPASQETKAEPGHAVVETSSSSLPSNPAVAGPTSFITPGLSNVRLPMPNTRLPRVEPVGREEDTDGEGEFHDAYDSAAELAKDAPKARQMKEAGNEHYKNGDFEDAVEYYTMALQYCPEDEEHKKDRAVYLANRAQGHLRLQEYDNVVMDCTAALELDPCYVKALLRRAQANEHLEKYDLALEDAKALLEIDPSLRAVQQSATRLETLQKEKHEKMKDEAIGKLKELGNSVLGNFGLSLDNFKMQQDPNTGSYSINFER